MINFIRKHGTLNILTINNGDELWDFAKLYNIKYDFGDYITPIDELIFYEDDINKSNILIYIKNESLVMKCISVPNYDRNYKYNDIFHLLRCLKIEYLKCKMKNS